jgi:uncharacterized protein with FMN-binding domain
MKRGLLIGVGTVGALGAVFAITPPQFGSSSNSGLAALPGNAPSKPAASTPNAAAPSSAAAAPSKAAKAPSKAAKAPSKAAAAPTKAAPAPTKAAPAPAGITGTFDGDTSQTRWGPVQVQIIVKDGKIVDASALQSPNGDRRSTDISRQSIPFLVQETLAAQSDQISGVGGASYTSVGWFNSLQSALKKAGL